jgi:hypothetical protein
LPASGSGCLTALSPCRHAKQAIPAHPQCWLYRRAKAEALFSGDLPAGSLMLLLGLDGGNFKGQVCLSSDYFGTLDF